MSLKNWHRKRTKLRNWTHFCRLEVIIHISWKGSTPLDGTSFELLRYGVDDGEVQYGSSWSCSTKTIECTARFSTWFNLQHKCVSLFCCFVVDIYPLWSTRTVPSLATLSQTSNQSLWGWMACDSQFCLTNTLIHHLLVLSIWFPNHSHSLTTSFLLLRALPGAAQSILLAKVPALVDAR